MTEELHLDRARAESFGSVADNYDRYRPGFSAALIDQLAAVRPNGVLDIACGTGKVSVALASRGLDVVGVELDPRMAEIARGHGIPVEIATFENWDPNGRQFDLITCGNAWHWINPALGIPKVAKLLRPGGTMARLWSFYTVDEPLSSAIDAIYRDYPGQRSHVNQPPRRNMSLPDAFRDYPQFTDFESKLDLAVEPLTGEAWVELIAGVSGVSIGSGRTR